MAPSNDIPESVKTLLTRRAEQRIGIPIDNIRLVLYNDPNQYQTTLILEVEKNGKRYAQKSAISESFMYTNRESLGEVLMEMVDMSALKMREIILKERGPITDRIGDLTINMIENKLLGNAIRSDDTLDRIKKMAEEQENDSEAPKMRIKPKNPVVIAWKVSPNTRKTVIYSRRPTDAPRSLGVSATYI